MAIVLISSCTKESNTSNQPQVVVEAYLQPDEIVKIKITREVSISDDSTTSNMLANINASILHNGNSFSLSHTGGSVYSSNSLQIIAGETYTIQFMYEGRQVTATASVPQSPGNYTASAATVNVPTFGGGIGSGPPTFPEPLRLNWSNANSDYHL
ncbi:MAG: DUF4249 family protein [Bacteroidia bacterium]|nr:DUF4249 family protein [Bacteroidia bacterium]